MFIPSTFNGMEDYGNLLLMRLLLRSMVVFLSCRCMIDE